MTLDFILPSHPNQETNKRKKNKTKHSKNVSASKQLSYLYKETLIRVKRINDRNESTKYSSKNFLANLLKNSKIQPLAQLQ